MSQKDYIYQIEKDIELVIVRLFFLAEMHMINSVYIRNIICDF